MNRLIRLFPRSWRERYADEFDALLDEVPTGPHTTVDIVLAAVRVRMRGVTDAARWARERLGTPGAQRSGAVVAVAGGALWALTFVIGSIAHWPQKTVDVGFILLIAAAGGILVAQVILSAGWRARGSTMAWLGVGASSVGMAILIVALIAAILLEYPLSMRLGWTPPEFWEAGMVLIAVGAALFGIAAILAGGIPRVSGALMVLAAIPLSLWLLIDLPREREVIVLAWSAVGPGLFEPAAATMHDHVATDDGWFASHLVVSLPGIIFGLAWTGLGVDRLRRPQLGTEPSGTRIV